MQRRKLFAVALAGALATGGLAACGDSPNDNAKANKSVDFLKIGMPNGTQTENHNPFAGTSSANALGYKWMIYEPLTQWNPVKPADPATPWLASDVKWATDYKSADITVRDNAKWSDGQPLTADDVAYTFTLLKGNAALNANAIPFGDITVNGKRRARDLHVVAVRQPEQDHGEYADRAEARLGEGRGPGHRHQQEPDRLRPVRAEVVHPGRRRAGPAHRRRLLAEHAQGEGAAVRLVLRQRHPGDRAGQRRVRVELRLHPERPGHLCGEGPGAPPRLGARRARHPRPVHQHHDQAVRRREAAPGDEHGDQPVGHLHPGRVGLLPPGDQERDRPAGRRR